MRVSRPSLPSPLHMSAAASFALALAVGWPAAEGRAQGWDPLAERAAQSRGGRGAVETERPQGDGHGRVIREELPPSAAYQERGRGVERETLDPVMAADGSGLPHEVWSGVSAEQFAAAVGALSLPPKSPALGALWRRVMTADTVPASGESAARFTALRIETLEQSGLIDEVAATLARDPAADKEPLLSALTARSEIGLDNSERGCEIARGLRSAQAELPGPIRADVLLINGLCAASRGDMEGAGLQAGLLRELDLPGVAGVDLLDAVAAGLAPEIPAGAKLSLLDYRILSLKGEPDRDTLIAAATPALLVGLARDPRTPADLRLAAGEAAARLNLLSAQDLAPLYRAAGAGGDAGTIERAGLFKSAESERTPLRKTRLIRAFLDEARRAGFSWTALQAMAGPAREVEPVPEIGWFAETAIEISLAAGDYAGVHRWIGLGGHAGAAEAAGAPPLAHWAALADIVDPRPGGERTRHLDAVARMAANGRFGPDLLHRLVTVLDALAIPVPMPLWELASRAPQPAGGHLPDTGVLSELAEASRKKAFAGTVLLVLRTLGPAGAEGANIIALGDALRALRRAGLEADARLLALEALLADWPRTVSQ